MRRTRRSGRGMLGRSSSRSRTGCLFAGCGSLALGGVCQCQRRRPPVAHTLGPAGTGPRKSHLHGVSVGGGGCPTAPQHAGLGMRQEGWARRDAPGGSPLPPPPQSGPRLSRGKNLPAPADPRRSAPLRVSCSPPPGGCTGRAPPPASVPGIHTATAAQWHPWIWWWIWKASSVRPSARGELDNNRMSAGAFPSPPFCAAPSQKCWHFWGVPTPYQRVHPKGTVPATKARRVQNARLHNASG